MRIWAYRRDGGESLVQDGQLCDATYQMVRTGQAAALTGATHDSVKKMYSNSPSIGELTYRCPSSHHGRQS
jgi:hypothetical protein